MTKSLQKFQSGFSGYSNIAFFFFFQNKPIHFFYKSKNVVRKDREEPWVTEAPFKIVLRGLKNRNLLLRGLKNKSHFEMLLKTAARLMNHATVRERAEELTDRTPTSNDSAGHRSNAKIQ